MRRINLSHVHKSNNQWCIYIYIYTRPPTTMAFEDAAVKDNHAWVHVVHAHCVDIFCRLTVLGQTSQDGTLETRHFCVCVGTERRGGSTVYCTFRGKRLGFSWTPSTSPPLSQEIHCFLLGPLQIISDIFVFPSSWFFANSHVFLSSKNLLPHNLTAGYKKQTIHQILMNFQSFLSLFLFWQRCSCHQKLCQKMCDGARKEKGMRIWLWIP